MPKKKKSLKEIAESPAVAYVIEHEYETKASTSRRNLAGVVTRSDRFINIDSGLTPFKNGSSTYGGTSCSTLDVRDAVVLCQKCYYNFSVYRNIIDLMTEFSVGNIYFNGGNEKSRRFFDGLFSKINLWQLQDKFFREYYRSGNVFIYRFDAQIQPKDVMRITQVFGEGGTIIKDQSLISEMVIPSRYIILNPADIQMMGAANFGSGTYYKVLTDYELAVMKNPKSDEDVAVFNALPEKVRNNIKKGMTGVIVPIDINKVAMVFYKKQDYEPFSVPMGYPVLEDINFKYEMKKIDMAVARTMQQMVLLITTGAEPDKGGINPKNIEAFRTLFANPSVTKTLVADYTTKVAWITPDIANFFNPQKYEVIDRDINIGLNNIFASDEKFANQQQKVDIFVARLEQGRNAFLNDFLIPEIKRIAENVNFKNFPTPIFEEVELKDNSVYAKIYAQLVLGGALTAEQGLKAISSNILPDPNTSVEEHTAYKALRDKGLYEPLVGGKPVAGEAGRPEGTKSPSKVITPIGKGSVKYDVFAIKDNLLKMQELETGVVEELKKIHKIKKLNKVQKSVAEQIAKLIVVNEDPEKWIESIASYSESPVDKNMDRVKKVLEVAPEHQIEESLASILLISQTKKEPE